MTIRDIADSVGGSVHDGEPDTVVTGCAQYDSRLLEPGGLFVAFPGQNVDGHDFAARAMAAGAAAVLAGRPVGVPAVVVDDVQAAFGRLASVLVDRADDLAVVGVTGSVGKTTTKDLLSRTLGRLGPTVAPPGNLNNEIGLPAIVSRITPDTRYAALELSARHVGDVAYLARMVRPRVGVVMNVGVAHLSEFGTIERTTTAKAELIEALPPDGHAVLNADDPRVAGMAARSPAPVTFFGTGATADVRAEDIRTDSLGRASFRLCTPAGSARVTLRLIGEHYVWNALAAAAATLPFTDDVALIADALGGSDRVSAGRMHVTETASGITVINDAYNMSPASSWAALRAAATLARGRRLVAVLGQMNELGPDSPQHHTELGSVAADAGVHFLIGVGNADARRIVSAAVARGVEAEHVPDAPAALELVRRRRAAGDVLLVKGSNSLGLQSLAQQLVAEGDGHMTELEDGVLSEDQNTRTTTGITVYGCEPDEAVLFREMAPDHGVVLTITEAAVSEENVGLAFGNQRVSVGHKTPITNSTLLALSRAGVEYVSTRSIGYDHIDVEFAASIGIAVENVFYSPDSVADYTLMLMLMAVRNAKSLVRRTDAHDYRLNHARGRELRDLTIGVIGTGRIGTAVMDRLRAFGCRILAYDTRPTAAADYVPLDELLQQSDIVTLHTPLTAQTHHLLNRRRIEELKNGAFIINTGRGPLLDTEALVTALENGRLGGAALDVLEGEKGIFYADLRNKVVENKLLLRLQELPNVIVSPHTAYYTDHALSDTVENSIINCVKFESGNHCG